MYEYQHAFGALGTNGKTSSSLPPERPSIPSGPVTSEQIDQFVREHQQYEQAVEQQRESERQEEQARWMFNAAQRAAYFEQNPGALAAAQFGGCIFGSLIWGAVIGAIASPKGERGGGAKWGILASMATCPMVPVWTRIGYFGTVMNFILAVGAPIAAARYRLKRKRDRARLPARTPA